MVQAMEREGGLDLHDPDQISRYYRRRFGPYRGDETKQTLDEAVAR